jgi:hypothetical protein
VTVLGHNDGAIGGGTGAERGAPADKARGAQSATSRAQPTQPRSHYSAGTTLGARRAWASPNTVPLCRVPLSLSTTIKTIKRATRSRRALRPYNTYSAPLLDDFRSFPSNTLIEHRDAQTTTYLNPKKGARLRSPRVRPLTPPPLPPPPAPAGASTAASSPSWAATTRDRQESASKARLHAGQRSYLQQRHTSQAYKRSGSFNYLRSPQGDRQVAHGSPHQHHVT